MPLTWDVTKIHDYENVTSIVATEDLPSYGVKAGETMWNPITTALVWQSISTGIGEITEENADEVYARIALVEKLHGASLSRDGKPRPITPEEVHAHIGLVTNVFPVETRAKFLKRQAASFLDDEKGRYAKQVPKEASV